MLTDVVLELSGVTKRFPGVTALEAVNLTLRRGEVHALLGANGAGKSTLVKILIGAQRPDAGEIRRGGAIVHVPQEVLMVPEFSIGRNILLGLEGFRARRGRLTRRETARVDDVLARLGLQFDAESPTSALSEAEKRLAQIARALLITADVIVLDEPTAVLAEPDAEHVLARLEALRVEGKGILYVTHRLGEVERIADRITILRDGRRAALCNRGQLTQPEMVRVMIDAPRAPTTARDPVIEPASAGVSAIESAPTSSITSARTDGPPRIEARELSAHGRFSHVSLTARAGAIVGLVGVQGAGHGEVLRAMAGVDPSDAGEIRVDGTRLHRGVLAAAIAAGILLVPADRRGAGVAPRLGIRDNLALSPRIRERCRRYGLRWTRAERRMTLEHIANLKIRPANTEAQLGDLSGGNQQKVVLARALEARPAALLVEEPTQGVDVGAKRDIHRLLRHGARERDCAVVMATSEIDELLGVADVIHVMRLGRLVASFPGAGATHADILASALR